MAKPLIAFRATPDALTALERLLAHYRKEFPTLGKADVLNRLVIEQAELHLTPAQPAPREKGKAK